MRDVMTRPPAHYNPTPKFGLWTDDDLEARAHAAYCRFEEERALRDGWCIDCNETFCLDDTFGYNPPCSCGLHCRDCHDAEIREMDDYEDSDEGYDDER
jgi:hypothetical protein